MQTTKRLETIQLQEQVNVIINDAMYHKIRFLCREIAKVEWSGVLFYKVHGTIQDVENMSIEPMEILLMDKGSTTFTEYSFDEDVAMFMMDKMMSGDENWANGTMKMGHIHSHNTMNVFFSGVDLDELHENCLNHNFYVSLIVNNFMEMTAKIAFQASMNCYQAKDESGEDYEICLEKGRTVMMTYDCKVVKPQEEIIVGEEFEERLTYILEKTKREEEERKAKIAQMPKTTPQTAPSPKWPAGGIPNPNIIPARAQSLEQRAAVENALQGGYGNGLNPNQGGTRLPFEEYKHEEGAGEFGVIDDLNQPDFDGMIGVNEMFLAYILRKGEEIKDDTVFEALDSIKASGEPIEGLTAYLVDNYADLYTKFFKEEESTVVMEDLLDTLQGNIETLEEANMERKEYEFLTGVIRDLTTFADNIENAWKKEVFTNIIVN